jgi:hypothetical protein
MTGGAPKTAFEARNAARLSAEESIAFECIKQIVREGRVADQYEIAAGIGTDNVNGGTVAGVINRLILKGYVQHVLGVPIQRGLWLRIVATGQQTAEPRCKAPHWRYRKEAVPSPTIHRIAETARPLAKMIEAKAKELRKPLSDFLMDCVYVGFHVITEEQ